MILAVPQPNFLPWLGFFYKWANSDLLVLLDDAQFSKGNIINRVKIKAPEGARWLTVPVQSKGQHLQRIGEVRIDYRGHWQHKLLGSITACYGQAPYFKDHFRELQAILLQENEYLVDLNIRLIAWLAAKFSIAVPVRRSSELTGITGTASERLASIGRALGATVYLAGQGGQKYHDEDAFRRQQLLVRKSDFQHPVYSQLWGDFIPGLSALDYLMNQGAGRIGQTPGPDSARKDPS
jgi:hypothetical protein